MQSPLTGSAALCVVLLAAGRARAQDLADFGPDAVTSSVRVSDDLLPVVAHRCRSLSFYREPANREALHTCNGTDVRRWTAPGDAFVAVANEYLWLEGATAVRTCSPRLPAILEPVTTRVAVAEQQLTQARTELAALAPDAPTLAAAKALVEALDRELTEAQKQLRAARAAALERSRVTLQERVEALDAAMDAGTLGVTRSTSRTSRSRRSRRERPRNARARRRA